MYCFKYKLQYAKKILHYVFVKKIMSRYNHFIIKKFVQLHTFLNLTLEKRKIIFHFIDIILYYN